MTGNENDKWVYRNEFVAPPEMCIQGHVQILLRANGIDTFSCIGINKPIEILFYPGSRITDCFFRTLELKDGYAQGEVTISIDPSACAKVRADVEISGMEDTCPVAALSSAVENGMLTLPVLIENPRLWWPAGYGSASLYRMTVRLYDTNQCVQVLEQLIGIKTVELVEVLPNGPKTFHFKMNGKRAEYERIFRLMANAHTNLMRIWGRRSDQGTLLLRPMRPAGMNGAGKTKSTGFMTSACPANSWFPLHTSSVLKSPISIIPQRIPCLSWRPAGGYRRGSRTASGRIAGNQRRAMRGIDHAIRYVSKLNHFKHFNM